MHKKRKKPKNTRNWRIDEMVGVGTINDLNTVAPTINELKKDVYIYKKVKKPKWT